MRGTWGWIPGPVRSRAYYAPALVAFVGGSNFSLAISTGNVGGIAWFPLGPREVYRPSYPVSRRYFENVNVSNTVINTTVINNYYNNTNVTNVTYVNRQVPGAIVAVPTTAFVQSQPVNRSAVRVTQAMVASAPVAAVAAVAPTQTSVRGAAAQREKPPARAVERPVVAHTAPPAPRAGFAAQQQQLAATPGKPLEDAERKQLKPDRAATPAAVRVIAAQPKAAAPTALPASSDGGQPTRRSRQGRRRKNARCIAAFAGEGRRPGHADDAAAIHCATGPAASRRTSARSGRAHRHGAANRQGQGAQRRAACEAGAARSRKRSVCVLRHGRRPHRKLRRPRRSRGRPSRQSKRATPSSVPSKLRRPRRSRGRLCRQSKRARPSSVPSRCSSRKSSVRELLPPDGRRPLRKPRHRLRRLRRKWRLRSRRRNDRPSREW